mgnify:CR=1 FL=1
MISIVCSTQEPKEEFKQHVIKSSGFNEDKVDFIFIENKNGKYSLAEAYNIGLKQAKYDTIVFLHDDLFFNNDKFAKKLIKHFDNNPEYGIIGLAGTRELISPMWHKKSMMGIVNHKSDGKTWESKYSDSQGDDIAEVAIVDGLFMAVRKDRIKHTFNEKFPNFDFYDIPFCVDNHLAGVKIGLITNIRVTHLSVGAGINNDNWKNNSKLFEELYGSKLPINVKRKIRKDEKIKVLLGCLSFANLTGSELYVYELAKELVKQNCEVTICSQIGNPLGLMAKQHGIKLCSIQEPIGYKLGDGEWSFPNPQNPSEMIKSTKGGLYQFAKPNFDIMHLNHEPITQHLLKLYPTVPAICSIHSEVIALEHPVINNNIKKYIAIRPEIKEYIVNEHGVDPNKVDVIYNPIDYKRFYKKNVVSNRKNKRILSISTIDYLRKNMLADLIETTEKEGNELWICGKKNQDDYLTNMIINKPHVKYFEPSFETEKLIHQCDETSGILLGRVTIESWLCGKPAWIYDVSEDGIIISKTLHQPPTDMNKFKSDFVASEIIKRYKEIIENE